MASSLVIEASVLKAPLGATTTMSQRVSLSTATEEVTACMQPEQGRNSSPLAAAVQDTHWLLSAHVQEAIEKSYVVLVSNAVAFHSPW
jgi:hypothetical protein